MACRSRSGFPTRRPARPSAMPTRVRAWPTTVAWTRCSEIWAPDGQARGDPTSATATATATATADAEPDVGIQEGFEASGEAGQGHGETPRHRRAAMLSPA